MFVSRVRAAADVGERSPYGDFWFTSLGRGVSGARVTADVSMQLAAVYACVRVLSESFAVLPCKLYRARFGGRGRELVTDHWLAALMRRPNRYQTSFEWREMMQAHLVLRGNAFSEIVDDGRGGISELMPMHPDRMRIELLDGSAGWRYRYTDRHGQSTLYRRDQVLHLRGLSGDGVVGMNPIEMQRETVAAGLSAQEYGNRFFANDAKPSGGWIELPGRFADQTARETFRQSWQQAQAGANRGRVAVLENGMKYHEVGMSNKDSQFLEARGYNRSEIAGIFRVPPHMVGDLSRATFSNIEQQAIDFWNGTMLPWTERWEAALETLLDPADGLDVEFDFRNLLRGDAASRASYIHNLVLDGVLTRNEGRELEGYDPKEGLDEPLVPANMRALSDPDPTGEAGPGKDLPDAPPVPTDDDSADARMARLLAGNAARLSRRFVRTGLDTADARVVADALAVPHLAAWKWIEEHATTQWTEDTLTSALIALGSQP